MARVAIDLSLNVLRKMLTYYFLLAYIVSPCIGSYFVSSILSIVVIGVDSQSLVSIRRLPE